MERWLAAVVLGESPAEKTGHRSMPTTTVKAWTWRQKLRDMNDRPVWGGFALRAARPKAVRGCAGARTAGNTKARCR